MPKRLNIAAIGTAMDVFVWGTTDEDHDVNVEAVLDRLQDKGLTVNPKKVVMKRDSLEFFGLKFSKHGIAVTDEKIKALKEAPLPKSNH